MAPGGIATVMSPTLMGGTSYAGNYGNYDGNHPTAVQDGMVYYTVTGWWHSLKSVTIAIRPSN